ncbi:MAG: plasmid mobilization relaxosome protein MobC [Lachnospiraceae bacterium]|jgi:hypothetical protein|nr:plasmid mobilization relaxosome protein MobC [Lachnospiraceae bacterium]
MANRTRDEVIYIRADERLKRDYEKQKAESGYESNADFLQYLLDTNAGKRVDGVTLKDIWNSLREIAHELKKQGVNINQIARTTNMYADLYSDSNLWLAKRALERVENTLLGIMEKLL